MKKPMSRPRLVAVTVVVLVYSATCGGGSDVSERALIIDYLTEARVSVSLDDPVSAAVQLWDGVGAARRIATRGPAALVELDELLRTSETAEDRVQMIVLLTYFKEEEAARLALRQLTAVDVSWSERRWIAEVLARHPGDESLAALVSLSQDKVEPVRLAAIGALPTQLLVDPERTRGALRTVAESDPSAACRAAAADVLRPR